MRMKKFLSDKSQLVRLVISTLAFGLILMILSCIGIIFGQFGWLIGVSIGTVVSLVNVVLLFKGSSFVLNASKASLFLLFYFLRMLLYVGFTVLLAFLDFKLHLSAFAYSVFGLLIAYLPTVIIVCIVMSKEGKNLMNIGELK